MSRSEILKSLINRPDAIIIIEAAQSLFEKEKEARHNFHDQVHENMKAEFIKGQVIMHSPVKLEHWRTSSKLSASLITHVHNNSLGDVGVEKVMIHLTRNDYETDICFFGKQKVAQFWPRQLLFPEPDFIVEILSPTTEAIDRTLKMTDYAAHGVFEYWIINPVLQSVQQYFLENGDFVLHVKLIKEGTIHAKAIKEYSVKLEDIF